MPTPGDNEKRSDYVSRCVPIVMKEGLDQNAAVGKCEGMFDSHTKKNETMEKKDILALAFEYLQKHDPEIAALMTKDMTAGDAHVSTALGNEDDKKKKEESDTVKAVFPMAITKIDPEQQKIFGWASVSMRGGKVLVDKQDDMILPDDLEKAAHDYALHWRTQGDMHKTGPDGQPISHGRLIESIVFTPDKMAKAGLSAIDPKTGEQLFGWFVAFKVDDPQLWEAHKAGKRPEFSIGGRGRRVPIE